MRRKVFDDDEWKRARLGHFSERDAAEYEALVSRWSRPGRSGGFVSRGVRQRVAVAANNWRSYKGGPEVVIKSASRLKTVQAVKDALSYIGGEEKGKDGRPVIRDGFGMEVPWRRRGKALEDWSLAEDDENLSQRARLVIGAGRASEAQDLSSQDRFHHVQAWHLVFSALVEDDDQGDAFERAMAVTIDQLFSENGYRTLWAVHTDCDGRLHAHVLLKAVSDFGKRARFDKQGDVLHGMRVIFADCLTQAGMPHQATRREDRQTSRQAILAGKESLRPSRSMVQEKKGFGAMELRASDWVRAYGDHVGQDKAPNHLEVLLAEAHRDWPMDQSAVLWSVQRRFVDPIKALQRWWGLRQSGDPAFADWCLRHRPQVFGVITDGAKGLKDDRELKSTLERSRGSLPRSALPKINLGKLALDVDGDRKRLTASLERLASQWEAGHPGNHQSKAIVQRLDDGLAKQAVGETINPMAPTWVEKVVKWGEARKRASKIEPDTSTPQPRAVRALPRGKAKKKGVEL